MRNKVEILEELRREIVSWQLPPGTHLSETKIGQRFGVSRTPVRQAIRQLVLEDLARFYPGRGAFVSEISIPDLVELFQMREALEPASAQLAAEAVRGGRPAGMISGLERQIEEAAVGLISSDRVRYFEVTANLDRALADLAGNRRLSVALHKVWAEVARAKRLVFSNDERLLESVGEHLEIVRSVASGDSERAWDVTVKHVRSARVAVVNLAGNPVLFLPSSDGRG